MGRYRNTKSNDDYARRSEKGKKQDNSRYDDSDDSSFFSDCKEDSHGDDYDGRGGRRFEGGDRRSGRDRRKDYHSDSDDSYNPPKSKKKMNSSYRERTRSTAGPRSRSRNDDSDSDQSDLYDLAKSTLDRPRNDRGLEAAGKRRNIDSDSDQSDLYDLAKRKLDRPRSDRGLEAAGKRRNVDSDSDQSDSYGLAKRALDRPRSDRGLGAAGKRSESRKDHGSDERGNFSSRIEKIRREHEKSSFDSDEESESDTSHSSRHIGDSRRKSRGPGLDSISMQPPRSRQQLTRSMSQKSFTLNSEQMQMTGPPRNNSQVMPSISVRNTGQTFFPGQQSPASGVMVNKSLLNQGQGQRMAGIPGNNLQGNINPHLPVGPGNMIRSMSGRSINTFSSGQVKRNLSNQNGIAQSQIQPRPAMMRVTSQRSLGNSNLLPDTPIQRHRLMRAASNRSLGNALQRPGLTRWASHRSLGNSDALRNTPINSQWTGFMKGASKGSLENNDGLPNTPMNYQQSGLIRRASQNNLGNNNTLLNNKSMHSQRPGVMRGASQRSLGNNNALLNASSAQYNPNVRIDTPQQSYIGTKNAQRTMDSTKPTAIAANLVLMMSGASISGDSVMPMSGESVDTSFMSSRTLRSSSPQSLADQIYFRSRQSDTQSLVSFGDPPGVDSNHFSNKRRNKAYSDDASYDSFRDDQKSYVTSNDPPDMFDDDQICRDITRYKPDPDDGRNRSYESSVCDDQQSFYSEDDSDVSNFDGDDKNSYTRPLSSNTANADAYRRESGGSISASSVSSDSSTRGHRNERAPGKPPSRFSSDLAFEFDREMAPPERIASFKFEKVADSNKKDNDNKNRVDVVATTPQQESLSWLAQQISTRKLTDMNVSSRSLEPAGSSTDDQIDSYSKNSTFESNFEDIIASDAIGHSSNILSMSQDYNKSKRGNKSVLDQNSILPSEIDHVLKYNISDALLISSASTTTSNTMTQEVPSVLMSRKSAQKVLYSDVDSLLSSPDDGSTTTSPRTRVAIKYGKKRNGCLIRNRTDKLSPRSAKKKSHTGASSRTEKQFKKRHSKKTTNKKNGRSDDVSKEVKKRTSRDTLKEEKSKKKNMDIKMKSSKKKKGTRKRRNKGSDKTTTNDGSASRSLDPSELEESQKSTTRVYLKSDGNENWISEYEMPKKETIVSSRTPVPGNTAKREYEKAGFEDQSVMNLIDKLKSFELYG
jgi:hypothetical protein